MKKQILHPSIVTRLLALGIDMMIIIVFAMPLERMIDNYIFGISYAKYLDQEISNFDNFINSVPDQVTTNYIILKLLLQFLIYGSYFVSLWYFFGATIGKYLTKCKLVSLTYSKLTFGQCVFRYLLSVALPLNLLHMLLDKNKQGIHDRLTSTEVIKT